MKKPPIFFWLFATFFFSIFSFSQNIKLEGTILENGKTPLEMANVMAVNQATKGMDAYSISNDKGKYALNLKPNTAYTIKVSYIGMQNKQIEIHTKTENITQNISLEANANQLEAVEIVKEMPVSIKGDTLVYNADSFKNGTEKKLEDVLKKLPGVEVNKDGEVEVEGKKVQKLMVEGKDFFDGDTKLGVKNIPADAIDKIQVLRNYSEIGALKGVENNQDNLAMNIKLKSGKKNFWFGDITAGIGVGHKEDRHIINPKIFYYSPKYSINVISNFNNIGELPLTMQDYFKMTGGFRNMMAKGGSSFNVTSNDLGFALMRNNRAQNIDTKFSAANFSYNPSKTWSLSGFGIFNSSKTNIQTHTQSTILATSDQTITEDNTRQKTDFGMVKLSSSYKPNTKLQFDYDILGKKSNQNEYGNLYRQILSGGLFSDEDIFTTKTQKPSSVNQNFGLYYTLNDKNIFAAEIQHLYQDENPFYNANLQNLPGNFFGLGSGYDFSQSRKDLNQNRFTQTNKLDAKIDYYYVVTPKSNLNFTLGNTYSYQKFNSHIFQILDDSSTNDLNGQAFNNRVTYAFNDSFLGVHYKMLLGKFTLNPGVSFHNYSMNNSQLGTDFKNSFTRVLPDFFALWQIKKSQSLTYNFSFQNNFTDINQLVMGTLLRSYSSLFRGNRELENSLSQVHSLRYFKYNMFNFENIFANATYTRQVDAIKSRAIFNGINQISTPYNSNFADETFSAMGQYGRSFLKYYKASFNASFSWNKFYNIINGNNNSTESKTHSYTLSTSTNYKKIPNLEVGYTLSLNNYLNNNFRTDNPFVRLSYFFWESFAFNADYEFFHYYKKDKTVNNEYDFLSASLNYQKKDSKWEYKVSATNLLNTKSLNDNSFDQFRVSNSQYFVQPRYIIFSIKYNL